MKNVKEILGSNWEILKKSFSGIFKNFAEFCKDFNEILWKM